MSATQGARNLRILARRLSGFLLTPPYPLLALYKLLAPYTPDALKTIGARILPGTHIVLWCRLLKNAIYIEILEQLLIILNLIKG